MIRSLFVTTFSLCWLGLASWLPAQAFRVAQPLNANGQSMKEEFEPAMRLEVDLIRRVVGLSDAATKKLEIAAMAAVKSASSKLEKQAQNVQMQAVAPFNEEKQGKAPTDTLSDEDEEKAAQTNATETFQMPFMFNATSIDEVLAEDIWKKTLQNTLTNEQRTLYDNFLAERKTKRRRQAVLAKVHALDRNLQLSPEQWDPITALVDRVLGDALEKDHHPFGGGGIGGGLGQVFVMIGGHQEQELSIDDLRPILSTTQLATFERLTRLAAQAPFGMPQPAAENVESNPLLKSALGFRWEEADGHQIVREVDASSPAAKAGLHVGDIIESVDDNPVDTSIQLKRASKNASSRKSWKMQVKRGNDSLELTLQ